MMPLYILKWIVGIIVLSIGILFGLSIAINTPSNDFYLILGATMIAVSFVIVGVNIFVMGTNDKKKSEEIKINKKTLSKIDGLSNEKRAYYRSFK
jgi:hypothetical protein